jgi:glycerophosphoryl diester phosphodiesterase
MDFGSWFNTQNPTQAKPEYIGAKVVPFEEQIDCYLRLNPMMRIHVETKDSAGGRAEAVMHELLTRKGLIATGKRGSPKGNVENSTIVLQSFDAGSLERMRMLNSTIPTGFLYAAPTQTVAQWQVAGTGPAYIDFFIPNSAVLLSDTTLISRFHAQGHAVHTWTVNDSNQMNTLLMLDVDGIFTNNPDLLRTAIDSRGTGFSKAQRGNPTNFAKGCPDIAGRVTSKDGPGDVWEATGERGVRLKTVVNVPASTPAPIPTSAPIGTNNTAANAGRFGGGGLDAFGVLGLLALLALRRF